MRDLIYAEFKYSLISTFKAGNNWKNYAKDKKTFYK